MFKVLLVDDESLVVESLKASVNWHDFGFEITGHAANGIEALEEIQKLQPDVVFTDIRMPGMNGLELIKKAGAAFPHCKFIVVSGFAEFAYAQKAMNYGAIGYCLKPFDEAEIEALLKKTAELLKHPSSGGPTDRIDIFELIDSEDFVRLQSILQNELQIERMDVEGIAALIVLGKGKLPAAANQEYIQGDLNRGKWALFVKDDRVEAVAHNLLQQEQVQAIGIGKTVYKAIEIKESLDSADLAAHQFFITAHTGIYRFSDIPHSDVGEFIKQLDRFISARNMSGIEQTLLRVSELCKGGELHTRHMFQFYNAAMSFLFRYKQVEQELYLYSYEELWSMFTNAQEMLEFLSKYVKERLSFIHFPGSEHIKNESFKTILQYIQQNFDKEISIKQLSEKFFMNPSYLSQLFKKELGETFTDYITKQRISFACSLLKETGLKINEISEKIGYEDYFYFVRTFKKYTGKTPTQYREEATNVDNMDCN